MVFLTNWPILNKWFIKQVSHETYSDKIVIVAFDLGVGANYCSLVHMDDSMQYIWSYTLRWKVWHKTLRKDNTNNIHVLDQITRGKNGALGFVSWYGPIRKTWQFNNEIASTTGTNHGEVHPTIQLCEGFARPNDKNGKGPPPPHSLGYSRVLIYCCWATLRSHGIMVPWNLILTLRIARGQGQEMSQINSWVTIEPVW